MSSHRQIRWKDEVGTQPTVQNLDTSGVLTTAVLVTTLIQAGLIDTPNLIMRLLTSSNILFLLLLALFARGSPIEAKKPKPKLAPIDTKLAAQVSYSLNQENES